MIRFDTFRFDYDTKNVIVFSRAVVVLLVRHALLLKVCSYKKLAIFTINVDAENQTLINLRTVCGALNRQFLIGAVIASASLSVVRLGRHTLW
jgi:hypothetical protein